METAPRLFLEFLIEEAMSLPPERRTSYLKRALADNSSLRRSLDVLDGDESVPSFLERLGRKVIRKVLHAARASIAVNVAGMPQHVSHFRIEGKLGDGGMGIVYKGRDTRLDRPVALKFLQPHLRTDRDARARFINEAKAASALDHPNIGTIFEIGTTEPDSQEMEGHPFIAMAYYDGVTLHKRLEDERRLPLSDALNVAIQVADGLASAHAHGITHRDIKPANLMLTDGDQVKILDFGLAKIAGVCITKTGTAMGSAAYMSPEQMRGERSDHRTDIWSLGVVLYEMLTGQRPFTGEYEQAIMYSILHVNHSSITTIRRDLPPELEKIVNTCLEKNPNARYQTMAELQRDLRSVPTLGRGDGLSTPMMDGPSLRIQA